MNTLIYIASASRSGSTILDNLLSNHPDAASIGELRQLSGHLRQGNAGRSWDWRCTCGLSLTDCPIWSATADTFEQNTKLPLRQVNTLTGRTERARLNFALACATPILPRKSRRRLMPYAYKARKLEAAGVHAYRIIDAFREQTNAKTIIDSSKTPEHLYALIAARPETYTLRVIHLIRDGRAVLYSAMNRTAQYGAPFSLGRATAAWCNTNLQVAGLRDLLAPSDWITVRYENLCQQPENTIRQICKAFQIPFDSRMLRLSRAGKHNIGGSPHRFNWSRDTKITLDNRWHTGLKLSHRLSYYAIAGAVHVWLRHLTRLGPQPRKLPNSR